MSVCVCVGIMGGWRHPFFKQENYLPLTHLWRVKAFFGVRVMCFCWVSTLLLWKLATASERRRPSGISLLPVASERVNQSSLFNHKAVDVPQWSPWGRCWCWRSKPPPWPDGWLHGPSGTSDQSKQTQICECDLTCLKSCVFLNVYFSWQPTPAIVAIWCNFNSSSVVSNCPGQKHPIQTRTKRNYSDNLCSQDKTFGETLPAATNMV